MTTPRLTFYRYLRDLYRQEYDEVDGNVLGYFFGIDWVRNRMMTTAIRLKQWEAKNLERLANDIISKRRTT